MKEEKATKHQSQPIKAGKLKHSFKTVSFIIANFKLNKEVCNKIMESFSKKSKEADHAGSVSSTIFTIKS